MRSLQQIGTQIVQELEKTLSHIDNEQTDALLKTLLASERIFVAGAGRSGLMIRAFAMRLMHMGCEVYVVGEIVTPSISSNDVLMIASGSGATESLVVMARKAKTLGARIVLLTIDQDSPIAKLADSVVVIPAPSPKVQRELHISSIQPMGSLFEQSLLLTLDAFILLLMERQQKTPDLMFTRHANLE